MCGRRSLLCGHQLPGLGPTRNEVVGGIDATPSPLCPALRRVQYQPPPDLAPSRSPPTSASPGPISIPHRRGASPTNHPRITTLDCPQHLPTLPLLHPAIAPPLRSYPPLSPTPCVAAAQLTEGTARSVGRDPYTTDPYTTRRLLRPHIVTTPPTAATRSPFRLSASRHIAARSHPTAARSHPTAARSHPTAARLPTERSPPSGRACRRHGVLCQHPSQFQSQRRAQLRSQLRSQPQSRLQRWPLTQSPSLSHPTRDPLLLDATLRDLRPTRDPLPRDPRWSQSLRGI